MLLIIELLFLAAGLWEIISGKIPTRLFGILFGKGHYELPPVHARLYGLLIASPLPVALCVSFILTTLLGDKAIGYALIFEYVYVISIIIISIILARRIRKPAEFQTENPSPVASPPPKESGSYGSRILIFLGLAFLSCITLTSIVTLIMTAVSGIKFGATWKGDFWSDIFPFILMVVIIGLGAFGIFKLYKLLQKGTNNAKGK